MAGAVTVKDKGWSLLKARLDKTRPRVKVGIFGDAAAAKAVDSPGKTVGEIASAHEFGLGVPERSWLRGTVDANEKDIVDGLRRAAKAVLTDKSGGLEARLLAQTGQHIAGLARERISAGIAPALSENYLPRKLAKYPGATTPLIASGQMWGAIGSVVEGAPTAVAAQRKAARAAARKVLARRRRQRKLNRLQKKAARLQAKVVRRATRAGKRGKRFLSRIAKKARRAVRGGRRRGRR